MNTTERERQIIRLLQTINDGLPQPLRRDESSAGGFVNKPSPRTCPDCLANGRTMKTCETCGGSGTVAPSRLAELALPDALPDDGAARDPYAKSDTVQPYGVRDTQKFGHVPERDAAIDRARALAKDRPTSEADAAAEIEPYVWERERERMFERFDYGPLVRALDALRDKDPAACAALHSAYVYGWVEPSTAMEASIRRGLEFVSERMPERIRAPRAPGEAEHPAAARVSGRRAA